MKYVWCILAFFTCLFLAWVGGFDFDSRGPVAFFVAYITIGLTTIVGVATGAFSKKRLNSFSLRLSYCWLR